MKVNMSVSLSITKSSPAAMERQRNSDQVERLVRGSLTHLGSAFSL